MTFAASYVSAGVTGLLSIYLVRAYGAEVRGQFGTLFAAISIACSIPAFLALETAARRCMAREFRLADVLLAGSLTGLVLIYLSFTEIEISLYLALACSAWVLLTVYSSAQLGVMKSRGDALSTSLVRASFAVAALIFLVVLDKGGVLTILGGYLLANVVAVLAGRRILRRYSYSSPSEAHLSPAVMCASALTGSAVVSIDALSAPFVAGFQDLGLYMALRSAFGLLAPIVSVASTRAYFLASMSETLGVVKIYVAAVAVLSGLLAISLIGLRDVASEWLRLEQSFGGRHAFLVSIVFVCQQIAAIYEERCKGSGRFALLLLANSMGLLFAALSVCYFRGFEALAAVAISASLTKFCVLRLGEHLSRVESRKGSQHG